jgi:chemotaxis response regulator CheB
LIRVLLVDDSASVRAVLRRFFSRTRDIQVVAEAIDGAQAVQAVLDHQPQVVVMDLQMPVMDGYVAIERIMRLRPTPIVVLSSRANRDQMRTAFEAIRRGALEVLPKPEDTESWGVLAESLPDTVRLVAEARPRPIEPAGSAPARGTGRHPEGPRPADLRRAAAQAGEAARYGRRGRAGATGGVAGGGGAGGAGSGAGTGGGAGSGGGGGRHGSPGAGGGMGGEGSRQGSTGATGGTGGFGSLAGAAGAGGAGGPGGAPGVASRTGAEIGGGGGIGSGSGAGSWSGSGGGGASGAGSWGGGGVGGGSGSAVASVGAEGGVVTGRGVETAGLRWVAIGASTGGPAALRELLEEVPADAPVSFLVVQHIAAGFEGAMAEWLNKELPLDVRLARDGEMPRRGTVRLAPAGAHLRMEADGTLRLDTETPARRGHRPSVDELFLSCATGDPRLVAGVLLTGMGNDGVEGLLALRRAGSLTLAQDEASSVVFGMPRVAVERGAADLVLAPRALAHALARHWRAPA